MRDGSGVRDEGLGLGNFTGILMFDLISQGRGLGRGHCTSKDRGPKLT